MRSQSYVRWSLLALVIAVLAAGLAGCSDKVCGKMKRCCQEAQKQEWVGRACGDIAMQTSETESCRTILESVRYLYQEKEVEFPKACAVEKAGKEES